MANEKGLTPAGDKNNPNYPRKWKDPVTKEDRLRIDEGHVDSRTGEPYDLQSAAVDHVHGYDVEGNPIKSGFGDTHFPLSSAGRAGSIISSVLGRVSMGIGLLLYSQDAHQGS